MANKILKQKALEMRTRQMSYSQIKSELGVSKSTLSEWLHNYPLSKERINELGPNNAKRIERYRNTMAEKQQLKREIAYKKVSKDIKTINRRELFLAGLFLYWAEGGKTRNTCVVLTNTNPTMLKFYIRWLKQLGVSKNKLKVNLHLYSDMNIKKEISFWSKTLNIPESQFRKPYIKKSLFTSITYKNGFGHGTCCIVYENKLMYNYVLMGLKRIQEMFD